MNFRAVDPDETVSLFVKTILIFEETENTSQTVLPFFADGYPGILFHDTEKELWVSPHNKQMPHLFLYGQTLKPIELVLNGRFKLIIFQLYPFVLKSFFNIEPSDLNDNCYNLAQLKTPMVAKTLENLSINSHFDIRIKAISSLLLSLFKNKQKELDFTISLTLKKIIKEKGQVIIRDLCREFHLTERTFERRFFASVGVTAKQFSKIIQFQQSLEQLTTEDDSKLADVVYANGFADQSHFIRVFKAFTGQTPLAFKLQK